MVETAAPPGTITEAFGWLLTAIELGAALGAAAAGVLVDRVGPAAAFGLGAGACAFAALITALHGARLDVGRPLDDPNSHTRVAGAKPVPAPAGAARPERSWQPPRPA